MSSRVFDRLDLEEARAGDIVALAGVEGVEIGTTLTDPEARDRLLGIAVEEPTLSVDFSVNNSPFSGRSGKYVTSRQLRDRLFKELERNLALRVEETGFARHLHRLGSGGASPHHPDGDHAPGRIRVPGFPAPGHREDR